MSEYQYYEFQAVDRPLTEREKREVRAYSSRATITSTRFVNYYNWGDFKGNPSAWIAEACRTELARGHHMIESAAMKLRLLVIASILLAPVSCGSPEPAKKGAPP